MSERGRWQGMLTIARLNWPFYLVEGIMLIWACAGMIWISSLWPFFALIIAGGLYFVGGSLGVSHCIYDLSDLYRWRWVDRSLKGAPRRRVVFCHSGFDEASDSLREKLAAVEWQVLDHFDEQTMTEASIRRARRLFPPTAETLPAPFDCWPLGSGSTDVVFGVLAIHELRSEAERISWFSEARRVLARGGRIVLVEHVRDWANFLAFGPGFLHFHSVASWRRCWEGADLRLKDTFRVTPWVRVFVITS